MRKPTPRKRRVAVARKAAPARHHRPNAEEVWRAAEEAVHVAARQTDDEVDRAIAGDPDTVDATTLGAPVLIRADELDVARIRSGLGLTQAKFSAATGIPLRLVCDWEQRRKKPSAAARALLLLLDDFGEKALKRLARHAA